MNNLPFNHNARPLKDFPDGSVIDPPVVCSSKNTADINLIVAVPELLTALQDAVDALNIHAPDSWVLVQARAVIAAYRAKQEKT